jgi:hypothetical protein
VLIVGVGLASSDAARADLIVAEGALLASQARAAVQSQLARAGVDQGSAAARVAAMTDDEIAALERDAQPAGGVDPTTLAVFLLMCVAIFLLAIRPDRPDADGN